jgi:hypothetical protein
MSVLAAITLAYLAALVWLTVRVARCPDLYPRQKVLQTLLLWLLPVLGPIWVHWFLTHGTAPLTPHDWGHIPQVRNHYGANHLPPSDR